MQDYLKPSQNTTRKVQDMKFLFSLRSRMVPVKCNYKGEFKDYNCDLCKLKGTKTYDTQEHLMRCTELSTGKEIIKTCIQYSDIFKTNVSNQFNITHILRNKYQRRKVKLKQLLPDGPAHEIQRRGHFSGIPDM